MFTSHFRGIKRKQWPCACHWWILHGTYVLLPLFLWHTACPVISCHCRRWSCCSLRYRRGTPEPRSGTESQSLTERNDKTEEKSHPRLSSLTSLSSDATITFHKLFMVLHERPHEAVKLITGQATKKWWMLSSFAPAIHVQIMQTLSKTLIFTSCVILIHIWG